MVLLKLQNMVKFVEVYDVKRHIWSDGLAV